jgi:hypothetical protein
VTTEVRRTRGEWRGAGEVPPEDGDAWERSDGRYDDYG